MEDERRETVADSTGREVRRSGRNFRWTRKPTEDGEGPDPDN